VRLRNHARFELIADKDAVVLDSATGARIALPRRVKEAGDGHPAVKIKHQDMRMIRRTAAPLSVPETCRLPVNRVAGAAILALHHFTVYARDGPARCALRFTVGANQGKLGNGGIGLAIVCAPRLNGEVAARRRCGKLDFLQGSSRREGPLAHGLGRINYHCRHALAGSHEVEFRPKFIEDGLVACGHDRLFRAEQIEDNDLILAGL
jgi:hypothetical protein